MKNLFLSLTWLLLFGQAFAQQSNGQNGIAGYIRSSLETYSPEQRPAVMGTELYSTVVIHRFYGERNFQPAWIKDGKIPELAYEMRYEIGQSKFDGLNPVDYHFAPLNDYFSRFEAAKKQGKTLPENELAAVDVLLTDAFIMMGSHLSLGKVDPENLKTSWNIQRNAPELVLDRRLEEALNGGGIRKSLQALYPSFVIYRKMREGLRELYDDMERFEKRPFAQWKPLKTDKSIKPDESNPMMPEIRKRLYFWGYVDAYETVEDKVYDAELVVGIKKLQRRHGMEPDGVIGQGTIQALNQTPEMLIRTAAVNLERLRWLPDTIKDSELILVNTANFQLDFLHNRDTVFTSKVIVGKSYHATPQFSAEMSYIVFSPTWTVPTSITRTEIIPAVKKNRNYLASKNMKLLNSSGGIVDPASIDWAKVNPKTFPYTVRQEPGESNSLGLAKFMFPNKHSVYIHDTPSRSLFEREDRALSHGCIRIQRPFDFAKFLLSHDPTWTDERIRQAMRQPKEVTVTLNRKIPVAIIYMTYWANGGGEMFFRSDIYGRDAEIAKALKESKGIKSGI
ncbi:L,D-transpeptidase family protein [Mariniradius sediminis]|uniref:L,D-transpeptidase family protein n=1 Tax=Mariniradius sediminis TaxID=2909237 RepID=A0ABS9BT01_9BACT|nr:L,D-transpeptidase family protein [Mariniradius sediminis]MCF1750645.1 L,D-transpeptidase family protein [Mariniradius sediminis]